MGPVDLSLTTARRRLLQIPSAIPAPTRLLAAVNFTDLLEISFVGCVFRVSRLNSRIVAVVVFA